MKIRIALLFLFTAAVVSSNGNMDWTCDQINPARFQCKDANQRGSVISVILENTDTIVIDCLNVTDNLKADYFANVKFSKVKRLKIQYCPFKNDELNNILKKFTFCLKDLVLLHGSTFDLKSFSSIKNNTELLKKLKDLEIRKTNLLVDDHSFSNFPQLESLHLVKNNLHLLPTNLFSNLFNLTVLEISANPLKNLSENLFQNCSRLKIVNLSNNYISLIPANLFRFNADLKEVYLSNNQITEFKISSATNTTKLINLSDNPLKCNCANYDLLLRRNFTVLPIEIKTDNVFCNNVSFNTFNVENITCSPEEVSLNCPTQCRCQAYPHQQIYYINCTNLNLVEYPKIQFNDKVDKVKHVKLYLNSNSLTTGPSLTEVEDYRKVTTLNLSHNQIKEIKFLPKYLQHLYVDHNKIEQLDKGVLEKLKLLNKFTLHRNPWRCQCSTLFLTELINNYVNKTTYSDRIFCANSTNLIKNLQETDVCPSPTMKATFLLTFLVLLSLLIICAFALTIFYRYKNEIKNWLISKQICLSWVTQSGSDKDKIYDAFISFAHQDQAITDEIIKRIEMVENGYKFCVHSRDWIPGEFIQTQIVNSVINSRSTIILLSEDFLKSIWAMMEFRTAYMQLQNEGVRIIIVLIGNIDIENLDAELKHYVKNNTYVEWGDKYFWKKLKNALPHKDIVKHQQPKLCEIRSESQTPFLSEK